MSRNSIDSPKTHFAANEIANRNSSENVKKLDLIPYEFELREDSVGVSLRNEKMNGTFTAPRKRCDDDKEFEICFDEDSTSRTCLNYIECEDKGHGALKLKKPRLHFSRLIKHVQRRDIFQATYDVVVNVWNNPFACHSFVLASYSGYFGRRLRKLKRKLKRKVKGCCTWKCVHFSLNYAEVTCQIFARLHHWMYTGQLVLSEESVVDVWGGAKYLRMEGAVRKCQVFVYRFLTQKPNLAMSIWEAAVLNQKDDLRIIVGEYLANNFLQIVNSKTFLEYNLAQVVRLLSDDHIRLSSEKDVLTAALNWLSYLWPKRCNDAEEIICCIRFNNMKPNDFLECIYNNKHCEAVQNTHFLISVICKCFEMK